MHESESIYGFNRKLFKVTGSHLHCKVVVSTKWCKIDTLLPHTTNMIYHTTY